MADLFISYRSSDRVWAERLYKDLKKYYPTIDIFFDRNSIPVGADPRAYFEQAASDSRHFALFWSKAAAGSKGHEIVGEVEKFTADRKYRPTLDSRDRLLFYIPLDDEYGSTEARQGFTDMRDKHVYDAGAADLGLSKVDGPARNDWNRIVRKMGDAILASKATVPVTLCVLAMTQTVCPLLDYIVNVRTYPGEPTLAELLTNLGLNLAGVKPRYGNTAFDWHPYGTTPTVVDLMEDLRLEINKNLEEPYRFHWEPRDILTESFDAGTADRLLLDLKAGPSVVVVDPLSLYNVAVKPLFDRLDEYLKQEESVVISLSPVEIAWVESVLVSLRLKSANMMTPYFLPRVPAAGGFAGCGLNLANKIEMERVVRHGLGMYHKNKNMKDEDLAKMRVG